MRRASQPVLHMLLKASTLFLALQTPAGTGSALALQHTTLLLHCALRHAYQPQHIISLKYIRFHLLHVALFGCL
jgi:hypothetical protein